MHMRTTDVFHVERQLGPVIDHRIIDFRGLEISCFSHPAHHVQLAPVGHNSGASTGHLHGSNFVPGVAPRIVSAMHPKKEKRFLKVKLVSTCVPCTIPSNKLPKHRIASYIHTYIHTCIRTSLHCLDKHFDCYRILRRRRFVLHRTWPGRGSPS